jgi:hypothetical protein
MKKHTKIYFIGISLIVALCFGLVYYVFFFNNAKSVNPKLKIANNRPNKRGDEYELFPNGLIYSAPTVNKLGKIVDSLNLKYKKCESKYDFSSISQTIGCIVLLEKRRVKQAKRDMMNNISFEDFIKKYPKAKYKKEVLILKTKYINFENKEEVSIDYMDLQDYNAFHIVSNEKNVFNKDLQNKWLFKYNKKDEYLDEYIEAFYFPNKFKMVKIPDKYAQKIGSVSYTHLRAHETEL